MYKHVIVINHVVVGAEVTHASSPCQRSYNHINVIGAVKYVIIHTHPVNDTLNKFLLLNGMIAFWEELKG
jgi:hypothetical protein